MEDITVMEHIDEVELRTHADLQQALSDVKFWANLAFHKELPLTVVFLGSPRIRGGKSVALKKREGGGNIGQRSEMSQVPKVPNSQ
jgi:hypothetical protein